MHHHQQQQPKRRKKRILYGTKTVTVVRGKLGYGFTISGQNPCMLSSIVAGSPADQAGLKPGDMLYFVNGLNVSRACHDDVVRMVGLSTGSLELQVAENCNSSDSSDDDYPPRNKSRYPNRVRQRNAPLERGSKAHHSHEGKRSQKPVHDDSDPSFSPASTDDIPWTKPSTTSRLSKHDIRSSGGNNGRQTRKDVEGFAFSSVQKGPVVSTAKISSAAAVVKRVPPVSVTSKHTRQLSFPQPRVLAERPANFLRHSSGPAIPFHESELEEEEEAEAMPVVAESARAVVGYIGSIEMPSSHTRPHQRLQALRNAVRRLRVEKRVHTLVLMQVSSSGITLSNALGKEVASYPASRIAFSGICPDDKHFFGLVTLGLPDDSSSQFGPDGNGPQSSSCHIFMIEPELSSHSAHMQQADVFQIQCTTHPQTRRCEEFPVSATSLILCIANLYRDGPPRQFDNEIVQSHAFADPVRQAHRINSNSSSNGNNSTSDSGLGGFGREDAPLEQNEQVCVVHLPSSNSSGSSAATIDTSGMSVAHHLSPEAFTYGTPRAPNSTQRPLSCYDNRRGLNNSTSSEECWQSSQAALNKLTPRAMPDPAHTKLKSRSTADLTPTSVTMDDMRQSMQRLLQARQRQLQEQNQHLESDRDSAVGNPVLSLSVAENGQAILEGGQSLEHVFAVPSEPPPGSSHHHHHHHHLATTPNPNAVRSAFQVPRPVSAPLGRQKTPTLVRQQPETVDMETMGKLSPRAFPDTVSPPSVFRSPSAPPAPFFPHRESDEDDDDEEDDDEDDNDGENENDPYIRQILDQFRRDRTTVNKPEDSRRFSEGFVLSQKVNDWLIKIDPLLGELTTSPTHLFNLVQRTAKQFLHFGDELSAIKFLNADVDINFISDALSTIGISKATIASPPDTNLVPSVRISNQVIVDLELFRVSQGLPAKFIFLWITRLTGCVEKKLPYAVKTIYTKYLSLKKDKDKNRVTEFLTSDFRLAIPPLSPRPTQLPPSPKPTHPPPSPKYITKHCDKCQSLLAENSDLLAVITSLQEEKSSLLKSLEILQDKLSSHQHSLENQRIIFRSKNVKRLAKFKQSLKQSRRKSRHLESELSGLLTDRDAAQSVIKNNKKQMRDMRKVADGLTSELELTKLKLEEKVEGLDVCLKRGDKNAYTDDVRVAVISLITYAGVAAANVSNVFTIVANNIFHHNFVGPLPCMYTCLKMLDEGYVISNIHAAESVLKSNNVTMHCDGTSRDHKKVVSHQLSTDLGDTLYLGFVPIASENAVSLLEISLGVLKDLAICYEAFSFSTLDEIRHELISKVTSVMSDRAAAMKLWGRLIGETFVSELNDSDLRVQLLHCNAHFLLGLSSSCEKALLHLESQLTGSLGRDSIQALSRFNRNGETATGRVIRLTCDSLGPRGDPKSGCRKDWISHESDSLIPSYRSNRFNCFFEAAATILFHRESIIRFFTSGILPEPINTKLRSVELDVRDDQLMSLLSVIALIFLKVSGPYWKLVNSNVKYYDFHVYVKLMYNFFLSAIDNPELLIDPSTKTVFSGDFAIESKTWNAVHDFVGTCGAENKTLINLTVKAVCTECAAVTKRQLGDFLDGGKFESMDVIASREISHSSLTNLIGESSFGDYDYDMSKRRNASLHSRSAVHSFKRNKTLHFLNKKSFRERSKVLAIARKLGPEFRKINRGRESEVSNEIRKQFAMNQDKKIQKNMSQLSKTLKVEEAVKVNGGPCRISSDVDSLISRLKTQGLSASKVREAISNEVRYQKVVLSNKSVKLGTLAFMISSLKQALGNPAENPNT